MDTALWAQLRTHIHAIARHFDDGPFRLRTQLIVQVMLWAAFNDRSVNWACQRSNWRGVRAPKRLPDQSTVSRRSRCEHTAAFLHRLQADAHGPHQHALVKLMDGKPLPVSAHSQDDDATWGFSAGQKLRGCKIHAIFAGGVGPLTWVVEPLNVSETTVARVLPSSLSDYGYVLADANDDSNPLHALATSVNHQLLARRTHAGAGVGRRHHEPGRMRSIELLKGESEFGRELYALRREVETFWANLVGHGGGLTGLPPWVRTLGRVRRWVQCKWVLHIVRRRVLKKFAA